MAIIELVVGNPLSERVGPVLEPSRFLAAAAAVVETVNPLEPLVDSRYGPARKPCSLLSEEVLQGLVTELRMRGLRIDAFTKLVAVQDKEGAVTIFAQSGAIAFKGPMSGLFTFKKFDWSGIAQQIQMFPHGDIAIVNPDGVFGRLRDNASTRVMLSTDADGDMVVRSLDKDESGAWRPIVGEFALAPDGAKVNIAPYEVRISLDPIYGVRQTEKYPRPSSVVIGSSVHAEVLLVQHTPALGVSRIESLCLAPGKKHVYHVKTTYSP